MSDYARDDMILAGTIRRVAAAISVVAALLITGCSAQTSSDSYTGPYAFVEAAPAAPAPRIGDVDVIQEPVASAPSINVYGELDGKPTASSAPGSEHSFQQHTETDEGYDADVVADPSGEWLAFSSTRHSEKPDIYLKRVDGQSLIQLTSDPADDVQPSISPDGKRIAFASSRAGNWDIYVMDIDGKNIELVTGTGAHEMHPSFNPDGTRLVYCALSPRNEQWELWLLDLTTCERKLIGHGLFPVWSPRKDIDRIAFQRARQRGSRWFGIWTLDLVDGEPRRLTEVASSPTAAVVGPAWSPDGNRLAYTTIMAPSSTSTVAVSGRRDVWIVDADGGNRQRLTEGAATNLSPFWNIDNRIYFVSDRSGRENIWSVKVATPALAGKGQDNNKKPAAVGSTDSTPIGQ